MFQETIVRELMIHARVGRVEKTGLVSARQTVVTNVLLVPLATNSLPIS